MCHIHQGAKQRDVAVRFGVSQGYISKLAQKFRRMNAVNALPRKSRRKATTLRVDQFIRTTAVRDRKLSGTLICMFIFGISLFHIMLPHVSSNSDRHFVKE